MNANLRREKFATILDSLESQLVWSENAKLRDSFERLCVTNRDVDLANFAREASLVLFPKNRGERKNKSFKQSKSNLNQQFAESPGKAVQALLNACDSPAESIPSSLPNKATVKRFYSELFSDSLRAPLRLDQSAELVLIEPQEITYAIRASKVSAPGLDRVTVQQLKAALRKKGKFLVLTLLFNVFLCFGIPKFLKAARVTLIRKKKNPQSIKDFRPVSVTSVVYRCFCRIINTRLSSLVLPRLSSVQTGNRPQVNGCAVNVATLYSIMQNQHRNFEQFALASVDIKKAHDSVYHRSIVNALVDFDVPAYLINVVKSVLSNVDLHIQTSSGNVRVRMKRGVQQGNPLSGILFNCALDQTLRLVESKYPLECEGAKVGAMALADDCVLLSDSRSHLCQKLDLFINSVGAVGLEVNLNKCASVIATPNRRSLKFDSRPLTFPGGKINCVMRGETFKYLGVDFGATFKLVPKRWKTGIYGKLEHALRCVERARLTMRNKLNAIRTHIWPKYVYLLTLLPTQSAWTQKPPKNNCRLYQRLDNLVRQSVGRIIGVNPKVGTLEYANLPRKVGGLGFNQYGITVPKCKFNLKINVRNHSPAPELTEKVFFHGSERVKMGLERLLGPRTDSTILFDEQKLLKAKIAAFRTNPMSGQLRALNRSCLVSTGNVSVVDLLSCKSLSGPRTRRAIKLRMNSLPVRANLYRWSASLTAKCRFGCDKRETVEHLVNDRTCRNRAAQQEFWDRSHNYVRDKLFESLLRNRDATCVSLFKELECSRGRGPNRLRYNPDIIIVNAKLKKIMVIDVAILWETSHSEFQFSRREQEKCRKYQLRDARETIIYELTQRLNASINEYSYETRALCLGRRGSWSVQSRATLLTTQQLVRKSANDGSKSSRSTLNLRLLATDVCSHTADFVARAVGSTMALPREGQEVVALARAEGNNCRFARRAQVEL